MAADSGGNSGDSAFAVGKLGSSIGSGRDREVTGALDGSSGSLEAVGGLVSWQDLYQV